MAQLNDFKLVRAQCLRMYEFIEKEFNIQNKLTDIQKARLGFYHLVMEAITHNTSIPFISETIIDNEYNDFVFSDKTDDLGIDAVYFSNRSKDIFLFNFKYHENFSNNNIEDTAISRSLKFLDFCKSNRKLGKSNKKVYDKIKKIRDASNSEDIYNITLYMITNTNNGFTPSSTEYIQTLKENYNIDIKAVQLDDIIGHICKRPTDRVCSFCINVDDFLKYSRDPRSTEDSYIVKLSLFDVIRIMGKNEEYAKEYTPEFDSVAKNSALELSLLYDNVRGYLGDTSFNVNIKNSLEKEPEHFFMFNNGLTFVVKKLTVTRGALAGKYRFSLEGFQLVNGGQTIRSIFEYLKKDSDSFELEKLKTAQVLVRLFKVSEQESDDASMLKSRIAEYTNSQNAIKASDLKSIDYKQIQIENYLKPFGILYARKASDVGNQDDSLKKRLPMELLAKILYAYQGFPERVTNQRKRLFTDYYDEIFGETLDLDNLPHIIDLFYKIKDSEPSLTEQEACYILYIAKNMNSKDTDNTISESIKILKQAEDTYKTKASISTARKIIQKEFRNHLDSLLYKSGMTGVNVSKKAKIGKKSKMLKKSRQTKKVKK